LKIEFETSYASLQAMKGDADLAILLREKGMPVLFNPKHRNLIVAEYGKFSWIDNFGRGLRKFTWECSDEEYATHSAVKKIEHEYEYVPREKKRVVKIDPNATRQVRFED